MRITEIIIQTLSPVMTALLLFTGVFLCIRLRGFFILHPIRSVKCMLKNENSAEKSIRVSPFSAMTMALAGTLGVGNIVGVATAITAGGPGAIFWMWVSGIAAMSVKYSEVYLAVAYRRHRRENGTDRTYGGAMYYIRDGFHRQRAGYLAAAFAILCAVNAILGGNILQAGAVAEASVFSPITTGILLAALTAPVICGKGSAAKRISSATTAVIPALSGIYILLSLFILCTNFEKLPDIFHAVWEGAFTLDSAGGGIFGFLTSRALRFGVTRGIFSNEAGCGTAPTAHAAADATSPESQSLWGIFEVFADTVVLCTMTALVILLSADSPQAAGLDSLSLSLFAFERYAGSIAAWILRISVFLFAYATILAQSYYGREAMLYLTKSRTMLKIYHLLYILAAFVGCLIPRTAIWSAADLVVIVMTMLNTAVLLLLSKKIKPPKP